MTAQLQERWNALASELGWGPNTHAIGAELIARYSEPHRHYHAVGHLNAVLIVLDDLAGDEPALATTRLAAWFHDAVYEPARDDNEEQSAELARTSLAHTGLDQSSIDLVADLVLATKSHTPGDLVEADLLLDADLSTLGAPPDVYDAYSAAVRREYHHVPDDLYLLGRPMVLRGFADRERLYLTEAGRARFEAQARANLARELASLDA